MTDPAFRERAALDVLALLPERWSVGPTSYDPGIRRWSYTARGPHPRRGKFPETITGTGEDDLAAMIDPRIRLDERRRLDSSRRSTDVDAQRSSRAARRNPGAAGRPLTADR